MKRYLTPSKIALLSLITLYCDKAVPITSTVPILSFVVSHILPHDSSSTIFSAKSERKPGGPMIPLGDLEALLQAHASASGIPGRTVWDLLLQRLWGLNSLDALFVFFEDLRSLLAKTAAERREHETEQGGPPGEENRVRLARASPLGTFVRRAQLEFARMQIHDSVALWKHFISYRQPTFAAWRRRNAAVDETAFDAVLGQLSLGREDALTNTLYGDVFDGEVETASMTSTEEVERLLEFQVDKMQRMGTRVPEEMRDQLRTLLDGGGPAPNLSHYVRFLDSWRAGDYPSSFDNLHRYFDYNMHERDRQFYQYALLNLASLQGDFGCYDEAIAAIHETISTARENKDVVCLNFSLNWLYLFAKAHPKETSGAGRGIMLAVEREGLAFLKTKARETGMWSLWSSTLLSEAQLGMTTGDNIPLIFENILKSSHLNLTKNMTHGVAAQLSMQSSLWARLGVTHLAWSHCEIFSQCYSDGAAMHDVFKMTCRSASILVQKGAYDEAMAQMEAVDRECLRTLKNYQLWTVFTGLFRLKRELNRNDLDAAEYLLGQLRDPDIQDPDTYFEFEILYIDYLARRASFDEALSHLETLSATLKDEDRDIYLRVRLLSLKAFLLDKCGFAPKGFSVAVRAASIAWRARLMPALWEALCAVSTVLIQLKEFEAAGKVLNAIMPQVLECEDAPLSALAYALLVDAHMGQAGEAEPGTTRRTERLTRASELTDCAFAEYSRIEESLKQCEMMAKKATIMHLMGEYVLANDYAAKYLELKKGGDGRKEIP